MPSRGTKIQKADLDALAALANEVLLPKVNALIALVDVEVPGYPNIPRWPAHAYTVMQEDGVTLASPQPAYAFGAKDWTTTLNRIRGDWFNLVTQRYGYIALDGHDTGGPLDADLYRNPDALVSGPWCVGVNDPVTFPDVVMGDRGLEDQEFRPGILYGTPAGAFSAEPNPLVLFKNVEFWTAPAPYYTTNHYALTVKSSMGDGNSNTSVVPDVENTGDTYTASIRFNTDQLGQLRTGVYFTVSLSVGYSTAGMYYMGAWTGGDNLEHYPPAAPLPADLGLTTSLGQLRYVTLDSYTHSFNGLTQQGNWVATYKVAISLNEALPLGETDFLATFAIPTAGWLDLSSVAYTGHSATVGSFSVRMLEFVFDTQSKLVPVNALHPDGGTSHKIVCGNPPAPKFSIGNATTSVYPTRCWMLSDAAVPGVWVANTLPTPGLNVFLDNDLPPYVASRDNSFAVPAVSPGMFNLLPEYVENYAGNLWHHDGQWNPPTASSMRQATLLDRGEKYETQTIPPGYLGAGTVVTYDTGRHNFNILNQSIQTQPSPWLVRRDTDDVPHDLGCNDSWRSQFVAIDTNTEYLYPDQYISYYFLIRSNTTAFRVALFQPPADPAFYANAETSIGLKWRGGKLGWGEPLATPVRVYVSTTGYPVPADPSTYGYVEETTTGFDLPPDLLAKIQASETAPNLLIQRYVKKVSAVVLSNQGYGSGDYQVGEVLTVTGGTVLEGAAPAQIKITAVDYLGTPTRFDLVEPGQYTTPPPSPQVPSGGSGAGCFFTLTLALVDVPYGLGGEVIYNNSATRRYIPQALEPFSYCLDGTPYTGVIRDVSVTAKRIPQSGYCIFKLRARRSPVINLAGKAVTPASGGEIVILVGQNKLQADGTLEFIPFFKKDGVTPYTITIPAAARDTGDVEVFWPVLGGNELVYQASEPIILEAYANWQPLFYNSLYAVGTRHTVSVLPNPPGPDIIIYPVLAPTPMVFTYALSFQNYFAAFNSGYPRNPLNGDNQDHVSHARFPVSTEIYQDLIYALLLLPRPETNGEL